MTERRRYQVSFRERVSEIIPASRYEEGDALVEFFDADIPEDESIGTRVFTRSAVVAITDLGPVTEEERDEG
jgi:hypothetical protein